jgi:hypothetical protein
MMPKGASKNRTTHLARAQLVAEIEKRFAALDYTQHRCPDATGRGTRRRGAGRRDPARKRRLW